MQLRRAGEDLLVSPGNLWKTTSLQSSLHSEAALLLFSLHVQVSERDGTQTKSLVAVVNCSLAGQPHPPWHFSWMPVLGDGFRAGEQRATAGESPQKRAKWLEKGCFYLPKLGSVPAAGR